jgi:hypothetical protein
MKDEGNLMSRIVKSLLFFSFVFLLSITGTQAQMPGDINDDSLVDLGDIVYEINYLFREGAYPLCLDCADLNGTCNIEVGDVVYMVNYLFRNGPTPQLPECDWSEPVNLGPVINTSAGETAFRLSPDGKMAVWSSNRPGGYGNDDIWYSYWNVQSHAWSEPHNCGRNINNGADDEYPSLSPDHQKLYCDLFGRPGTLGNFWDAWVSTWDSLQNEWGLIVNLGPTINLFGASSPFISPDGTKLYFNNGGLWVSEWNGADWGQPAWLGDSINIDGTEMDPVVTADDRTLYFSRTSGNVWYIGVSYRTAWGWGPVHRLGPQINDSLGVKYPYITPDGSKLYFSSGRSGGFGSGDIWVSERIPVR